MPAPPARQRSAKVPCGLNSISSLPSQTRYMREGPRDCQCAPMSGGFLAMMAVQFRAQHAADGVEFRAGDVARAGEVEGIVALDAAGARCHHHDTVGEEDRLLDRV